MYRDEPERLTAARPAGAGRHRAAVGTDRDGDTVISIRDGGGGVVAEYDGGGTLLAEYVSAQGRQVARIEAGPSGTDDVHFLHTAHSAPPRCSPTTTASPPAGGA